MFIQRKILSKTFLLSICLFCCVILFYQFNRSVSAAQAPECGLFDCWKLTPMTCSDGNGHYWVGWKCDDSTYAECTWHWPGDCDQFQK